MLLIFLSASFIPSQSNWTDKYLFSDSLVMYTALTILADKSSYTFSFLHLKLENNVVRY